MPATVGTVPSMLESEALVGLVLLYADETADAFPITKLFGPLVAYDKSRLIVDRVMKQAKLGEFKSRPAASRTSELERFSQLVVNSLYQAEQYAVSPDRAAVEDMRLLIASMAVGDVPAMPSSFLGMAEDVRREFIQGIFDRVNVIRRTHEWLAIQMLTSTSFTVTVDGRSDTVDWHGLVEQTANASWATAATKLVDEMGEFQKEFRAQAGGDPEIVVVGPDFDSDYINGNTQMLELLARYPEFAANPAILGPERWTKAPQFEVFRVQPQYVATYGASRAYMWPAEHMTFVRAASQVLENATVRTPDNNHAGGYFARMIEKVEAPRGFKCDVTYNAIPIIKDPTQVMTCDLIP